MKIIVVHSEAASDLAPRTRYVQHFAQCGFIAQLIVVNLHVVATDVDVGNGIRRRNRQLDHR